MHIKVKKQRSIKTKENRTKHTLQPDSAKFNQYKGFCTAVGYKPLKWTPSDWKFLFTSNTLNVFIISNMYIPRALVSFSSNYILLSMKRV